MELNYNKNWTKRFTEMFDCETTECILHTPPQK